MFVVWCLSLSCCSSLAVVCCALRVFCGLLSVAEWCLMCGMCWLLVVGCCALVVGCCLLCAVR